MIVRNTKPTKPAKQIKVKRDFYLQLLSEHADLKQQLKETEKYESYLNQALVLMAQSEDLNQLEFVRDCKENLA